jgi:hypothetical protein
MDETDEMDDREDALMLEMRAEAATTMLRLKKVVGRKTRMATIKTMTTTTTNRVRQRASVRSLSAAAVAPRHSVDRIAAVPNVKQCNKKHITYG